MFNASGHPNHLERAVGKYTKPDFTSVAIRSRPGSGCRVPATLAREVERHIGRNTTSGNQVVRRIVAVQNARFVENIQLNMLGSVEARISGRFLGRLVPPNARQAG